MRVPGLLILAGLALVLTGCQNGAPTGRASSIPAPDPARLAMLPADEVAAAAKLYALKCAKCHQFYDPAQYTEAEWSSWMTKMAKKARLQPDQREILSRYLDSFRHPKHSP